ncbi:hypothetical protein QBC36DRAFT_313041 [Triangularia setosa]|uniref:Uncharacterized protein n=1 Tax=Triangularia setosa TaxID=2587417 RepID=A0AAN6W312_9PEZI|nr:hypothetical protein QBC36DRAFT_313041 [Podospora setosa]
MTLVYDIPSIDKAIPKLAGKYKVCVPRATSRLTSGGGVYSWTTDNDSMYLWDAGLWGACAESKRIVAKVWEGRVETAIMDKIKQYEEVGRGGEDLEKIIRIRYLGDSAHATAAPMM